MSSEDVEKSWREMARHQATTLASAMTRSGTTRTSASASTSASSIVKKHIDKNTMLMIRHIDQSNSDLSQDFDAGVDSVVDE